MGEVSSVIQKIREDKNNFGMLLERMKPLINKYTKLLYKDEKEDVYSEMVLALWEAVMKMEYYNEDSECTVFLCTALKNKFLELYRNSKKYHDNCTAMDQDIMTINQLYEDNISDIILENDLKRTIEYCDERKKIIFTEIVIDGMSDSEIAHKHNLSRQYINRLRRELYNILRKKYFI